MTCTEIHRMAMEAAWFGDRADPVAQRRIYTEAALLECLAVTACELDHASSQPSHAILCRSAAWLLVQGGRPVEALDMTRRGMDADPPAWAVEELEYAGRDARDSRGSTSLRKNVDESS